MSSHHSRTAPSNMHNHSSHFQRDAQTQLLAVGARCLPNSRSTSRGHVTRPTPRRQQLSAQPGRRAAEPLPLGLYSLASAYRRRFCFTLRPLISGHQITWPGRQERDVAGPLSGFSVLGCNSCAPIWSSRQLRLHGRHRRLMQSTNPITAARVS